MTGPVELGGGGGEMFVYLTSILITAGLVSSRVAGEAEVLTAGPPTSQLGDNKMIIIIILTRDITCY